MRPLRDLGIVVAECEGNQAQQRLEAMRWARRWVAWRRSAVKKPCVVFDIDATLVHKQQKIAEVCALYEELARDGVAVFVITARSGCDEGRRYTREEMDRLQITRPRHLFLHPPSTPCQTATQAALAKRAARERIASKGYTILVSVGDAFSDHFVPSEQRELQHALGTRMTAVFVDPADSMAHVKLGLPLG